MSASPSLFQIRTAQPQDLRDLADLLADSFHERQGWKGLLFPVIRMGIYEDLRHRLRSKTSHYVCFVAVDPTRCDPVSGLPVVVGTVELSLRLMYYSWPYRSAQSLYVSNLAVQRSARRQGVAKQLLNACEQIGLEWGFPEIYLHVLDNNHPARRLYFKIGYRLQQIDRTFTTCFCFSPKRMLLRKILTVDS